MNLLMALLLIPIIGSILIPFLKVNGKGIYQFYFDYQGLEWLLLHNKIVRFIDFLKQL